MKNKTLIAILGLVILIAGPTACSYNNFVKQEERVKETWSYVQSAYQRRADLIPNLVNTVKGAANFEKETLTGLVEARAKATQVKFEAEDLTEENMAKFQAAQAQVSSGLGRLLAIVENYPDLKATQNFRDLQVSLDETENRIKAERDKFNTAVKEYNVAVRKFPANLFAGILGFKTKAAFASDPGADKAPDVQF